MILSKHGVVTFGDSAREAYERMIAMASLAEDFIARNRKIDRNWPEAGRRRRRFADVAPIVRGACSEKDTAIEGAWRRLVVEFRTGEAVQNFVAAKESRIASQPSAA